MTVSLPLDITIPFPPSWNDKHISRKPLEELVARKLSGMTLPAETRFEVYIHVRHHWVKRNGKPVRRDVVNYAKVAEDAVMRALRCDDAWNWRIIADKREGEPGVRVVIRALTALPPEGAR